jgi:hypothetical protein
VSCGEISWDEMMVPFFSVLVERGTPVSADSVFKTEAIFGDQ